MIRSSWNTNKRRNQRCSIKNENLCGSETPETCKLLNQLELSHSDYWDNNFIKFADAYNESIDIIKNKLLNEINNIRNIDLDINSPELTRVGKLFAIEQDIEEIKNKIAELDH